MINEIRKIVLDVINEITNISINDYDEELFIMGITSYMLISCIIKLEEKLNIEFNDEELNLDKFSTVEKITNIVKNKL